MLKLLGFRYSYSREAWVHRIRGGRFGPVFTETGDFGVPTLTWEVANRLCEPAGEWAPDEPGPADEPSPADDPAIAAASITSLPVPLVHPTPDAAVVGPATGTGPVNWEDGGEVVTVFVDGRPPRRGATTTPDAVAEQTDRSLPRRIPSRADGSLAHRAASAAG